MTVETEKTKRCRLFSRKIRGECFPQDLGYTETKQEFTQTDSFSEDTDLATDPTSAIILHSVSEMPTKHEKQSKEMVAVVGVHHNYRGSKLHAVQRH